MHNKIPFGDNKEKTERVNDMQKRGNFIQKGMGLYAVALCICALALLIASARIQLSATERVPRNEPPAPEEESVAAAAAVTPKPTALPKSTPQPETPAPTDAPSPVPAEKMKFTLPVTGEVQKNYSGDRLVKSSTLRDWRVHRGIDITAPVGTEVRAAQDGVVKRIYFDDELGISILVDHQNGLETLYQNLSTDTVVAEGQAVRKGDALSGVGDTASCEIKDTPHLHFVVLWQENAVDPMDYIEK